jgi:hypothetical protein
MPYLTVTRQVHGRDVTISIFRSGRGLFRGSWVCSSLVNCRGASGVYDSDVAQVVDANEANAYGAVADGLIRDGSPIHNPMTEQGADGKPV